MRRSRAGGGEGRREGGRGVRCLAMSAVVFAGKLRVISAYISCFHARNATPSSTCALAGRQASTGGEVASEVE